MQDPTRIKTPAINTVMNSTLPKIPDPASQFTSSKLQKRLPQPEVRRIAGAIIQGKPKLSI